jgi:uncharacterized protein (DUF697 family)
MPGWKEIAHAWNNLREFDLRPIRELALQPVRMVIVGREGSGRHTLADALRRDPRRPEESTQTPVVIAPLEQAETAAAPSAAGAPELIIVLLDVTHQDFSAEHALLQRWLDAGKPLLVLCNKLDLFADGAMNLQDVEASTGRKVVAGSALDLEFLAGQFVPAAMALLPAERSLALARNFPLFRGAVARHLIDETCISNAAYALGTGLAEIIPALDLPFNIADMVVLTKAQAFLAYKLGLAFGFSVEWQAYAAEFGSVIGSGFIWRQFARQLVGLIPVWGILPKVGVAYAGTYVVGQAVYHWYLTGRHLTRKQLRALYGQAFARGKQIAQGLIQKAPRLKWKRKKAEALPPGDESAAGPARPAKGKRKKLPPAKACPACEKPSAADAAFCQYCGAAFEKTTA